MPLFPHLQQSRPDRLATDADAADYLRRVQIADGQPLEPLVRVAIHDFVVGLKQDGIWTPIKSACILAGARTLTGALVPLVGAAPTSVNFVGGDYDRKRLKGDGTSKYLDSSRNANADPQNNQSMGVWRTVAPTNGTARVSIGAGGATNGATRIALASTENNQAALRNRNTNLDLVTDGISTGLSAMTRSSSIAYIYRGAGVSTTITRGSQAPVDTVMTVFAARIIATISLYSDEGIAFYWIGEALDLALMDARVSALMTALGAAIP